MPVSHIRDIFHLEDQSLLGKQWPHLLQQQPQNESWKSNCMVIIYVQHERRNVFSDLTASMLADLELGTPSHRPGIALLSDSE